ncbi:MAG: DUF2812 domain-containing protein [Oscillospiraceae bacterium]|nr:DUF2812 domain-containing protein [Oscillospiraceae bacterium]
MRNEKRFYPLFSNRSRTGLVNYLEKKAMEGWLFTGFSNFGWKFRRIPPQKIRFSIVYFAGISWFDAAVTPELMELRDFCAHNGWEYVDYTESIVVFRNDLEDPVPIQTEPLVELENIHKIATAQNRKELFYTLPVPLFWMLLSVAMYFKSPISFLTNSAILICAGLSPVIILARLVHMTEHALWYRRAKRYAITNHTLLEDWHKAPISKAIGVVCALAVCAALLRHINGKILLIFAMYFLLLLVVCVAVMMPIFDWIKNRFYDRKTTKLLVCVCCVVVVFAGIYLIEMGLSRFDIDLDVYAPQGSAWAQYEEVPPISAEEFYGQGTKTTSYRSQVNESVFLAEYRAWNYSKNGKDSLDLDYTVLEVKWDALYSICLKEYLDSEMFPVDAAHWGAEEAYRYGTQEEPKTVWLLCYEDRIVEFYAEAEPTPEQMALVGSNLGNEQKFENNKNK